MKNFAGAFDLVASVVCNSKTAHVAPCGTLTNFRTIVLAANVVVSNLIERVFFTSITYGTTTVTGTSNKIPLPMSVES